MYFTRTSFVLDFSEMPTFFLQACRENVILNFGHFFLVLTEVVPLYCSGRPLNDLLTDKKGSS